MGAYATFAIVFVIFQYKRVSIEGLNLQMESIIDDVSHRMLNLPHVETRRMDLEP